MIKYATMILVALTLAATVPAFAEQTNQEKVICQLASKNCLGQADVIQQRMKKMNADIQKGTKSYPPEELKKLEQKLQEARDLLDKLEGKKPGK